MIPEIVEFSELAEFIENPFNTYSTGMRMRLAFSISTMAEPDILLLDEWIGAGDAGFRAKVEAEFEASAGDPLFIGRAEEARIKAQFAAPPYRELDEYDSGHEAHLRKNGDFAQWATHNLAAHKRAGYAIVALFVFSWLIAVSVWRFGKIEQRWSTNLTS